MPVWAESKRHAHTPGISQPPPASALAQFPSFHLQGQKTRVSPLWGQGHLLGAYTTLFSCPGSLQDKGIPSLTDLLVNLPPTSCLPAASPGPHPAGVMGFQDCAPPPQVLTVTSVLFSSPSLQSCLQPGESFYNLFLSGQPEGSFSFPRVHSVVAAVIRAHYKLPGAGSEAQLLHLLRPHPWPLTGQSPKALSVSPSESSHTLHESPWLLPHFPQPCVCQSCCPKLIPSHTPAMQGSVWISPSPGSPP